ncbi:hypothetical protein O181_042942 [Austropuccinia psidii MF-1]|uniref:Uncharacterized protein n=1 Tax=Austropuccinia psidii MF-1 TaxID=1389203 RepID=A0A9Q3DJL0_9BASI|nr:hypothetical protein [Austropuccinia psidii MF-1]
MSPVHLRNLAFQRNQPEDRKGLSKTRRPGRGHLGHSGGWGDTEGSHTHSSIHFPIQQEPQTRGLEIYGSSSSAPPTPQIFISMEHGQQEAVQTPGGEVKQDKGESSHYPSYRGTADPERKYSDSFRLTRSMPNQLSSGFTPFRNQQISGQESPFFTISRSFQDKPRIQGKKQDHLQPDEERVRPNDPEAVRIEHNVVTPESNLNSDALWLQISQNAEQTQKPFEELEASHERMRILTASMDKIVKNLQEGHAQLSKASGETNKRLNLNFEEQHHRKRDSDCLDQDINKLFNVYHSMKPQPQDHVMDNPYHQDEIKPDAILINKARSPSQYNNVDNMSYSEKEALKELPEASS